MNKTYWNRFLDSCSDNRKSKTCTEPRRRIQNLKWGWIVAIGVTFALFGAVAAAQQAGKIPRIGYLSGRGDPSTPDPLVDAFRQGLRDLGYIEGKNILVEYRYAEGKLDRIPSLVADLVQLKVDVLVSPVPPAIRAAKQATSTIPIVMVTTTDPVATGLVDSLARPGGNITGLTRLTRDLSGKRLELLKEAVPRTSRVGVLWDADDPAAAIGFKEYEAAVPAMKIQLQSLEVRGPNADLEGAFHAAARGARARSSRSGTSCSYVTQSGLWTLP